MARKEGSEEYEAGFLAGVMQNQAQVDRQIKRAEERVDAAEKALKVARAEAREFRGVWERVGDLARLKRAQARIERAAADDPEASSLTRGLKNAFAHFSDDQAKELESLLGD